MTAEMAQRGYAMENAERAIINTWSWWYRKQGYHKIARFDRNGRLGAPYVLYKLKNMWPPEVRAQKMHKARPITPGCAHPMASLLGLVGRAWSFIIKQIEEENCIVHTAQSVPKVLENMTRAMKADWQSERWAKRFATM